MQIRSILFSVFSLVLFQGSAIAENWIQVGPSPSDYTQYYDSSSVGRDGAKAGLVSLTNYASPQSNSEVAGGSRNYSSQTFFMVFDCTSRQVIGIGQFMWFSNPWAAGDLVFKADGFDTTHRPINADTANEAMYSVACR
ncbi:MAG: surface-adhesin E family protein [Micropepsaceae bacterium]